MWGSLDYILQEIVRFLAKKCMYHMHFSEFYQAVFEGDYWYYTGFTATTVSSTNTSGR